MLTIAAADAGNLYSAAHRAVISDGDVAAPRGQPTREIGGAVLELSLPQHRLAAVYERRLNPFLMLAEVLWILGGRDDIAFVSRFSKGFASFAPPGSTIMPDAYGPRLRRAPGGDQLAAVLRLLEQDRDTRRAFVSFWQTSSDSTRDAFAVPCNIGIDFKLRPDGLRMTVFNRSNDLHIGFLFNLVQFGVLGEIVAARLGVHLARQAHVTTSLHVYTDSEIERRLGAGLRLFDLYSVAKPLPVGLMDDALLERAVRYVGNGDSTDPMRSVSGADTSPWLTSTLLLLAAHTAFTSGAFERALDFLEKAPRSDWWILAAETFARLLSRRKQVVSMHRLVRLVGEAYPDAVAFVTADALTVSQV